MAKCVPRQLQHRLRIRRRKALVRRLAPRQPQVGRVLTRRERDRRLTWHGQAKHKLGILRHPRRIAVPPDRVDFIDVGKMPVAQAMRGDEGGCCYGWSIDPGIIATADNDAGFFCHFAPCGLKQGFVDQILGTGHRLPIARRIGPFNQQHFQCRGMDYHQHRFRDFERLHASGNHAQLTLRWAWRYAGECAVRAIAFHPRSMVLASTGTARAGFSGRRLRRGSIPNRSAWSPAGPARRPGRHAVARRIAARRAGSRT